MSAPVPSPRPEVRKPVPTPRKSIQKPTTINDSLPPVPENEKTFSRRVRSLSSASKQIAGDISDLFEQKTRQSVRKLTRHFSFNQQTNSSEMIKNRGNDDNLNETMDIFNNIKFDSPLTPPPSLYNNAEAEYFSSSESISLPPPKHPPPPLPDESFYDAPASLASSSSNSGQSNAILPPKKDDYESVFPIYGSNNDSSTDLWEKTEKWRFYDTVAAENIYQNDNQLNANQLRRTQPDETNSNTDLNSINSDMSVRNSLYENHEIKPRRPSESVLLQFDPLQNSASITVDVPYDLKLLEKLLQGDLYGTISRTNTIDDCDWSISNDSEPEESVNIPPLPPERFDSLPDEDEPPIPGTETASSTAPQPPTVPNKSRTSWFATDSRPIPNNAEQKTGNNGTTNESKKFGWFKQVLDKAPEVVRGNRNKNISNNTIPRPPLDKQTFIRKRGMLYKMQNGPVEDLFGEYSARWCILENSSFICYSDNTCEHVKEQIRSENILSVQLVQDCKYRRGADNEDHHCFELNVAGKGRGSYIYGTRSISEQHVWMQHIAESLTGRFITKITSDYTRLGWAYVRQGVTGKWIGAWIVLSQREFSYAIEKQTVKTMDLRKARCIVLQPFNETDKGPLTGDKGPNLVIDCPDMVLYLRMWTQRETKVWCHKIKVAAHNNGAALDQQQLLKNNVPVIVEKCINFIFLHGSMSEGIYRRSGTGSLISDILANFRKDAFNVELTTDKYSEYEVGTALKRFFRDLPEPLLGSNQREYLYQVSKHNNADEKIRMYKAALEGLPEISYNTAKKLFGHLHFINSQSEKNLMTTETLSVIWGPTLMHNNDKRDNRNQNNDNHRKDSIVVEQIISLYRYIFPEDSDELQKEKLMLNYLERFNKSPQGAVVNKNAGDFKVWIHLRTKEGKTVHVTIGSNRTAYDVCKELSGQMNLQVHELILEEVILNGRLTRPVHHSEKVLEVVLRWSYWDEIDRKDNYLVLVPLSKYWEFIRKDPLPVSAELKFADSKSRYLKQCIFEFSQAKLCILEKKTLEAQQSWRIEDILWYVGHEAKRNPPWRYTITFFELNSKPNRSRNSPYFGNILAWNDPTARAKWLGAMLKARYPDNLMPPCVPPTLLDI